MVGILMELPDWMIWMSFRYVLGRQSYAPGMWMDWARANWEKIPRNDRELILKEIKEYLDRWGKPELNRYPDGEWKAFMEEMEKKHET